MSVRVVALFLALCFSKTVSGQNGTQAPSPDDNLMKCMDEFYKKSPSMDAKKMMDIQTIQVGTTPASCPGLKDMGKFDKSCETIKELKQCVDTCPDTSIKDQVVSAFKGAQFICIDRGDAVKKNMPCLSNSCPDVQRECVPKCGSVENNEQKITDVISQVRRGQQNVSISQLPQLIGDACTTIGCFISCSEAPVTKACGNDGYLLQRDLVWTMFTSLAQSISSLRLEIQWPDQCKNIPGMTGIIASSPPVAKPLPAATESAPPVGTSPPVAKPLPAATVPAVATAPVAGTSPPPAAVNPPPPVGTSPPVNPSLAPIATQPPPPVVGSSLPPTVGPAIAASKASNPNAMNVNATSG